MKTYEYPSTSALCARAAQVLPCGMYGHFDPLPYLPGSHYPFFASRAQGSRFWDVDGNEFIDYLFSGYGPHILGYHHPAVDEAFHAQMKRADTVSIASPVMIELAELLVDTVSIADWAFFTNKGADAMDYAIAIACARTLRTKAVYVRFGLHGTPSITPWLPDNGRQGLTLRGIIEVPWNDVAALESMIDLYHGQIAAFISPPYYNPTFQDNQLPAPGYWKKVEQLLRDNGIVFIMDDRRSGFRLDLRGSNELYGFKPDLVCFSNVIANGYPISALVGADAFKDNTTARLLEGEWQWYGAGCMAAAIACIKELKRIDAPTILRQKGTRLLEGMVQVAKSHGYPLKVSGEPAMPFLGMANVMLSEFLRDLAAECTRRGAFFTSHHNWFLTTAHTDEDIQRTLDIFDDSFKAAKQQHGS